MSAGKKKKKEVLLTDIILVSVFPHLSFSSISLSAIQSYINLNCHINAELMHNIMVDLFVRNVIGAGHAGRPTTTCTFTTCCL